MIKSLQTLSASSSKPTFPPSRNSTCGKHQPPRLIHPSRHSSMRHTGNASQQWHCAAHQGKMVCNTGHVQPSSPRQRRYNHHGHYPHCWAGRQCRNYRSNQPIIGKSNSHHVADGGNVVRTGPNSLYLPVCAAQHVPGATHPAGGQTHAATLSGRWFQCRMWGTSGQLRPWRRKGWMRS